MVAVLSDFPIDVQRLIADPRSAILPRFKDVWPFVERVRRACEDIHGPTRRRREWDERTRKQFEERAEWERELAAPRVDLKAKYGENYGLTVTKLPDNSEERTKQLARMAAYAEKRITSEYRGRGEESRESGGMLISRSLVENIRAGSLKRGSLGHDTSEPL